MKIKMKFVELKAAGVPLYKIAKEIGVHRTTLTHWYKELAPYILIAKQDIIDELFYENCSMKISRVEKIARNLGILYGLLDESDARKEFKLTVADVLDQILKYTKLLNIETGEKNIEKYIKGKSTNEDEENLWITNKENFHRYQPEDENGTDLSNAVEISEEDETLRYNLEMKTPRDESGDEEVQKVFQNTLKKKYPVEEPVNKFENEKPVKNSSNEKKSENMNEAEQKQE
jgi:hypothetical protein